MCVSVVLSSSLDQPIHCRGLFLSGIVLFSIKKVACSGNVQLYKDPLALKSTQARGSASVRSLRLSRSVILGKSHSSLRDFDVWPQPILKFFVDIPND